MTGVNLNNLPFNDGPLTGTVTFSGTPAAVFLDDKLLTLGTDSDIAQLLRSATLNANTAVTSVLIGTPVSQALPANSFMLSNVTASGDIALYVNKGGNSIMVLWADGSAGDIALLASSSASVDHYINGTKVLDHSSGAFAFQESTAVSGLSSLTGVAATTSLTIASHVTGGVAAQRDISIQTGTAANPQILASRMLFKSNAAQGSAGIVIYESLVFGGVAAAINDSTGSTPASFQIISTAAGGGVICSGAGNNTAAVARLTFSNAATSLANFASTLVGIGQATPTHLLHITGTASAASQLLLTAATGCLDFRVWSNATSNLAFNAEWIGGAWIARHTYLAMMQLDASMFQIFGSTGNTAGNAATFNRYLTIDLAAGGVTLGLAGTNQGLLNICGATSGTVGIAVAAAAGTWTMTLPTAANANAGYQLTCAAADSLTSWAAAGSRREWKNISQNTEDFISPSEALDRMLGTKVYPFTFKDGYGTGDYETLYQGVLADEAPWAMHYKGGILNPISSFGYTILSIQALNEKIDKLESRLEKVGG